jgi:hypothetical protein
VSNAEKENGPHSGAIRILQDEGAGDGGAMMSCRRLLGLVLAALACATTARAQSDAPAAALGRPAAALGRPRPMSAPDGPSPAPIRLAAYESEPTPAERLIGPQAPDVPSFSPPSDVPPHPAYASPSEDFLSGRPSAAAARKPSDDRYLHTSNFGERIREQFEDWLQPGQGRECDSRRWFESDHAFDYFASPVSMPFLLEDPRSVTEIRPIFIFQSIPNNAPSFQGGHAEFYGTKISLAVTERFSFIINKLGFTDVWPGAGSNQPGGFGFSEMWLGPKFTFLRSTDNCLLGAAGIMFQIPAGPDRNYQNTGRLSVVPYATFGKNFLENRFGSLNFMNTTGFAFGDDARSDYLYSSFHLDWDVANRHRFYPLIELTYFQYTGSGNARNLDVEGRDLFNIGDQNSGGRANFNMAFGARYKLTESAQMGFAAEFPLNSRTDMQQFRFTVDFIWRY